MQKLLISLLCLIQINVIAQNNVIIDFKKKEVTCPSKESLRKSGVVQVKIINLPTKDYKVNINKTDSFVSIGTPPPLFSLLSFGDGFSSLLAGLTSYTVHTTSSPSQTVVKSLTEKGRSPASDNFAGQIGTKETVVNPCYTDDAADINESIKKMRNDIFNFHYSFRDEVIKPADALIYQIAIGELKDGKEFRKRAERIISIRLEKDKKLEGMYVLYYDNILKLKNYDLVRSCAALKAGDSMLTVYKRNFDLFLNKFDTTFNEILIAKLYKQLSAPEPSNEFISLPYTINGDITKLNIDITGIDASKTPQSYNTTIELNKYPNRLWAFTTGIFVSGLKNDEFAIFTHVQPNAVNPGKIDTLNYSIIEEKNNGISAGINALMHFGGYFGNKTLVGGFVTFGPGLTLEKNPQVRVMLGGGLLFGRNNKLALSFGWAGGPVKRLAGNYNTGDTYNPAPSEITRDQFKGSWFASLGFALFGK
jgi:hypothetical protein